MITVDVNTATLITQVVFEDAKVSLEHIEYELVQGGYPVSDVAYENIPPTADAGTDQTVDAGETVMLDGSDSYDPDDDISLYLWEQTGDATRVSLSDPWAVQPAFTAPQGAESLTFRLTVTDSQGEQSSDTVIVHIKERDDTGYEVASDLWIRAVIQTLEKGPIEAVWQKGGEDLTEGGHQVIWGYFYASPEDVNWGSRNNPDVFVKIWFDAGGRTDVNFFHVSVPDIDVYSDYLDDTNGISGGTTTLEKRYIRQYYENNETGMDENEEDGNAPEGYLPAEDPSGNSVDNDLRLGVMIDIAEKGLVDAVWRKGGEGVTAGGHRVIWGHFYANPSDVDWGSPENPDLFLKIWFDAGGRVDVNYFHVSVPDIEVYSAFSGNSAYDEKGTTSLNNRYIRHEFRY